MIDRRLKIFSSLDSIKRLVVEMRAAGDKWEAIAAAAGICMKTVHNWIGLEGTLLPALNEYKAFLASEAQKTQISLQEKLRKYAEEALDKLRDLALNKQGNIKSSVQETALASLLDRYHETVRGSKADTFAEIKNTTKEDREEMFQRAFKIIHGKPD